MKKNEGVSLIYVVIFISVAFVFIMTAITMQLGENSLAATFNQKSKAYCVAESGIYYGGVNILKAVQANIEPDFNIEVDNPFQNDYVGNHGFKLTIVKEDPNYRVLSEGFYDSQTAKVEALVSISGDNISYSEMKKIN